MGAHPILTGGGASDQSIYQEVTAPRHPVGTRACLPDGRVYYYSRNGAAALDSGKPVMAEVITTEFDSMPAAAAAIGSTSVTVTLGATAVTLNEYAEGYLIVHDDVGEGQCRKIKSHPVAAGAATCAFELYDGIEVALTTASDVVIVKNPWQDVVIAAAAHAHMVVGVPNIDVTASQSIDNGTDDNKYYFWSQTWGICPVWDDAATATGESLQSGSTEGQVEVGDGAAQYLGVQFHTGVIADYMPKFLTIAP